MYGVIRKFNKYAVVLFVLVLMSVGHLFGQTSSARLHGQITDASGALVPGANISLKNQAGKTITAISDEAGNYHIQALPPGQYTFTAGARGFAMSTQEITVTAGQDLAVNTALKIAVQQLEIDVQGKDESQEGQGKDVGVSSEGNASALVISGKEIDYLADDPSDLGVQLLALAGPVAGPNGGHVYVDGFASGYLPPKISIREIKINQNPFAAEQDRLGFGKIEVFTKPGSGQFHGQFIGDENNAAFNSGDPFAPQKLSYNSNIFTGDIWGPLKKNLTGYLSFQRRMVNDATPVNAIGLDSNFNDVSLTDTIPHSDRVNVIATRFDYQIGPNHTVIGRYSYTGVKDKNLGIFQNFLASKAFDYDADEHRMQLSANSQINPRTENNIRFEFKRSFSRAAAVNSGPGLAVTGAFEGGASNIGRTTLGGDYYELQNHTLMTRGRHVIKFGGRMRTALHDSNSVELANGEFAFDSLDAYRTTVRGLAQDLTPAQIRAAGGGATTFTITTGNPHAPITSVDGSLYAQDDWRIRSNLNIGYGLRFEAQNVIHDHFDLAPRLGLAWGIDGGNKKAAKLILRTGFGVFFDRFTPSLESNAERLDGAHAQLNIVNQPDFFPNVPPANAFIGGNGEPLLGAVTMRTITQIDRALRAPYTVQTGISLERQLRKSATVSVLYLYSRGIHQLFSRNVNAPLPGTFDPANPASGIRPFGPVGNIYQFQSEGVFKQKQLITSLNLRTDSHISLVVKHTLNFANSNVAEAAANFPANQYDRSGDYGRSSFDIRNRISIGGVIELPRKVRLSPFLLLKSGTPFNITLPDDINGDSIFNDRPAIATDLSRPSVVMTSLGAFDTQPLPGQKIVSRNSGTGPAQYTLNLRLGRTFTLGQKKDSVNAGGASGSSSTVSPWNPRYTVGFNVIAQNILNHVNPGLPVSVLGSPLFGQSNTLAGGAFSFGSSSRRITFQTSFSF